MTRVVLGGVDRDRARGDAPEGSDPGADDLARVVRAGLGAVNKTLPPVLFYDERGSALFDAITALPEYYPTRTERAILEGASARIAAEVLDGGAGPLAVLELGAGSATKTEVVLGALAREHGRVHFFPADVSPAPLEQAARRLAESMPDVRVSPIVGTHAEALERLDGWPGQVAVVFLGSSIGNYEPDDATALLRGARRAMGARGRLVLGLDRVKPLDVLLPAYDDPAGVTAAFNRNVLVRLNRELDGDFDVEAFSHVALWNESSSAVEMHLESTRDQRVRLRAIDLSVEFRRGERIHTESSRKYGAAEARALFDSAELAQTASFEDERGWFSVHVARAA